MSARLAGPEEVTQFIVAAAVVRLSAVMLLTFGIRVLLTLYSYHRRLAEFYEARARAVAELGYGDLERLERLTNILSPEKVTFGDAPESPMKEMVALLKSK